MKKIKFNEHILPHLVAVLVFLIVTLFFFNPIFFENKAINQHDINQHIGSAKILRDYRTATGDEGLWASSMFSGMPAYLVNVEWGNGVVSWIKAVCSLFLPHPVSNIFLAFLCYYVMLLAFRIRPWLAIAGAVAFGLSSYMIIGLAAGHNARIGAIAFMPLVIAGIHLAFTGKRILGFGVTSVGLALHLRENHLQITYYMMLIVGVYGLIQFIGAVRAKQLNDFLKTMGLLIVAAVIAAGTFLGPFWAITEYSRYSIRGPSELVRQNAAKPASGLSKEYAFAYRVGLGEPITLLVPNFYGGNGSIYFVQDQNSKTYKALAGAGDNQLANQLAERSRSFWGLQDPAPYYGGAIICFLFVLGILLAEKKYVWWLVPVCVLSILLTWGDSFASFNYFMFDYFPGYNMFRSVTFALIIILFCLPLLGFLGLEKLFEKGINKDTKRKLIIAFSATGGLCLLMILFAGVLTLLKEDEAKLPIWFLTALQDDRRGLLRADAFRSLGFIFVIFILLFLDIPKKISAFGFFAFLTLAVSLDLAWVDNRYFTKDSYQRKRGVTFFEPTAADQEILKDKSNYRVFNLVDPWNEARTSYYHRSLGGYHGAKIRRYQDLYDSAIIRNTRKLIADLQTDKLNFNKYGILNMLNAKYIVYGPDASNVIINPAAIGNAWFVRGVFNVNSPNEELERMMMLNTRDLALVDGSKFKVANYGYDSLSRVRLVEFTPPRLKYESESAVNGFVVFSEIYYPKGWVATIDGKEAPIFRANYVLRGLEVPSGKHVIEFTFAPKPYVIGNKITMASSWILLLLTLGSFAWTMRKNEETKS